ncbi:MAG: DUF4097 family beta strand repeat protein [Ruminococcus sp.]|nr:DUF4097 family beta strand repeat protein [Ruminococcus sp.]
MKTLTKIALIIAVLLIVAGITLFSAAMFTLDFDFSKLDNSEYITNTHEFNDGISYINVDVDTTNVKVLPSEDDTFKVVCKENKDKPHKVSVENNTLMIDSSDKKWFNFLTIFNFNKSEITLYIPERFATAYTLQSEDSTTALYTSVYQVSIDSDTGDITVEDVEYAKSLNLTSDTGKISVSNTIVNRLNAETDTGHINLRKVTVADTIETDTDTGNTTIENCKSSEVSAKASTGDITLKETEASHNINTKTSTGDITFTNSDAENIYAKSSTGHITGSVLTSKTFRADSSTGNVSVPGTTGIGIFEAKTSTGDINLSYSEN